MQYSSIELADAVRRTIEKLEEMTAPDDPKLAEIRRSALLRLAELREPATRRKSSLLPDHASTSATLPKRATAADETNRRAGEPPPTAESLPGSEIHLSSKRQVADILRATLLEVEGSAGLPHGDPSLVILKEILVRRIADLEAELVAQGQLVAPQDVTPNATS